MRSLPQNALGSSSRWGSGHPRQLPERIKGGERYELEAHQVCLAERQLLKHVMGGSWIGHVQDERDAVSTLLREPSVDLAVEVELHRFADFRRQDGSHSRRIDPGVDGSDRKDASRRCRRIRGWARLAPRKDRLASVVAMATARINFMFIPLRLPSLLVPAEGERALACGPTEKNRERQLPMQVVLRAIQDFRREIAVRHDTSQRHGADHRGEGDDGVAARFLAVRRVAGERDKELLEDLRRRGLRLLPGPGQFAPQGGEGTDGRRGIAVGVDR